MAFVTYILLAALYSGVQSRFHPEILGRVATRALGVVVCEFAFMKLGCYLLNISGSHQVTDLFAYSGYKFVGYVCLKLFFRVVWGLTSLFLDGKGDYDGAVCVHEG